MLSNSNFVKCPICMDRGFVMFENKKNALSYSTVAKCICSNGNKYNSTASITELGFNSTELAKSNVEKYNMTVTQNGCYINSKSSFDIEEAKKMCKSLSVYVPTEVLF